MTTDYKRLYRSRNDRMISGVCGGLGKYFGIDPTLVRLLFVFGALLYGPGLVAYLILMIIVPEEPLEQSGNAPTIIDAEPKSEEETA